MKNKQKNEEDTTPLEGFPNTYELNTCDKQKIKWVSQCCLHQQSHTMIGLQLGMNNHNFF